MITAFLLKREIELKHKALAELEGKDFAAREAELEAEISAMETEEQRDDIVQKIMNFESEKREAQEAAEKLRSEIDDLEKDLEAEEKKVEEAAEEPAAEPEPETKEERGAIMPYSDGEIQERTAFANYVRGIETRDDYNMVQSNNTAIIPKSIASEIITKVKELSPIFAQATKFNAKGTLEVPYYPASADHVIAAAYANEMAGFYSSSGDFSAVELTGFVAGALAKISKKLINNTDIDVVPFIVDQMAEAFAAFYEKECLVGTDSKVTGMLAGITQYVTGTYKSSVVADDLISCQLKVPTALQRNCCWLMAPATFESVRKLKDENGNYLVIPDFRADGGYSILGKPVYLSENMPALGTANNKAVVYGDLSGLGIKVTEELNIEVLKERFADVHAVGVIGWTEFDAKVINAQKLATIKCGSSDPQ